MPQSSSEPFAKPHTSTDAPTGLSRIFRALRHRNYKLFFAGQLVSLVGSFLTMAATAWLIERFTHSARMLGLVALAGQVPTFILSPFAGVWADRLNRRRVLVITQSLAMVQSFALAYLALTGRITVGQILALSAFQGLINAFDLPARQAFLVEMVTDRQDLANAIALNSTMVHAARVIGPATAGLLIWLVGEGYCFLLDGISYIGVIAALLAMQLVLLPPRQQRSVFTELKAGFVYIWQSVPIRTLLLTMAFVSLTAMPAMSVLMPVFGDYFGGSGSKGAAIYTLLGSASGCGALVGALLLAGRRTIVGLAGMMSISMGVFGASLIAFGFSRSLLVDILIVPFAGWSMITLFAGANTVLQTLAEDDMRGRVMSFFSMAFVGMTPFGAYLAGLLASAMTPAHEREVVGAARTLIIEGATCLVACAIFRWFLPRLRNAIRPIYIQKGILPASGVLPEVATGLQMESRMSELGED